MGSRWATDLAEYYLLMGTLRLVPYDPQWPIRFVEEAARIRSAIGAHLVAIEHVGSTAVPGMMGKPVIDIAAAVESEDAADACIDPLERLAYRYRGLNGDDPRRRYFVLDVAGVRTTQLHLYILPAVAWGQKLKFRDALRRDPELSAAYAAEKHRVAELVGWAKEEYALAKGPFILATLAQLR